MDETIGAIGDLIKQGKILYWGVCGWNEQQLQDTLQVCQQMNVPIPISHQLLYNLLERGVERQMLSMSADLGLGVMAWSPLAGGVLAHTQDKRTDPSSEISPWLAPWNHALTSSQDEVSKGLDAESMLSTFQHWADQAQVTPAQLGLLWTLRRAEISSLIIGVSSMAQLKENLAISDYQVSQEIWDRIEEFFPL